jgi:hypothetical protein
VTFYASVTTLAPGSGTPDQAVGFYDGTTLLGVGTLQNGLASFTTAGLSVGQHLIQALYFGDATFAGSASTQVTHVIVPAPSTAGILLQQGVVQFGQTVTIGVGVGVNAPGFAGLQGVLTLYDAGSAIASMPYAGGYTAFTTNGLLPGTHPLWVEYSGNGNVQATRTATVSQTVVPDNTVTIVQSSAPTAVYGQPITYGAQVFADSLAAGPATGTITFYDGARALGTVALVNGVAFLTVGTTTPGVHDIYTVYSGSQFFAPNDSAPLVQTVVKANTAIASYIVNNYGGVGIPVTVIPVYPGAGVPTGLVTFYANNHVLGTEYLVNGQAGVFYVPKSVALNKTIVVSYSGDGNFNPSVTAPVLITKSFLSGPRGSFLQFVRQAGKHA